MTVAALANMPSFLVSALGPGHRRLGPPDAERLLDGDAPAGDPSRHGGRFHHVLGGFLVDFCGIGRRVSAASALREGVPEVAQSSSS